jgi:3-methyladenine DNA glycosylase/8-oxoguanine DNA glycosylase
VAPSELRPDFTFMTGQCFGWRPLKRPTVAAANTGTHSSSTHRNNSSSSCCSASHGITNEDCHIGWVGVLDGRAVAIRQAPDTTLFAQLGTCTSMSTSTSASASTSQEGRTPMARGSAWCATDIDVHRIDTDVACTSAATGGGGAVTSEVGVSVDMGVGMGSPPLADALREYFQLEQSLAKLYEAWAAGCPRMSQVLPCLPGVRVVRQDPFECLVSFICSSNNNIKRITLMLDSLRRNYGIYLGSLVSVETASGGGEQGDGLVWEFRPAEDSESGSRMEAEARARVLSGSSSTEVTHHDMFAFPTPHALATAPLPALRALGLGYRDKFISRTAELVAERGRHTWLGALRANPNRLDVQKQLTTLSGVGAKVERNCGALYGIACEYVKRPRF